MQHIIILILALNVSHYLGDFTPLNRWFIKAKRYGRPMLPVLGHGAVNGTFYGLTVACFAGIQVTLFAFVVETLTYTVIDVLKGRVVSMNGFR
jgi:hypothetical protein